VSGSDQSVAVSALVLLDLDQKLLVSAQETPGLVSGSSLSGCSGGSSCISSGSVVWGGLVVSGGGDWVVVVMEGAQ
jgi:hypothetical protein